MAARCQYCGEEVRPNSMFCLNCGQLVMRGQTSRTAPVAPSAPQPPLAAPMMPPVAPAPAHVPVDLTPPVPAAPPAAATPVAPPAQPVRRGPEIFALSLSTGDRFSVSGDGLIGRRPEEAATREGVEAFTINDNTRSVSRVHVHVRVQDGQLVLTDRSSANGTRVERHGVVVQCAPGAPVATQAGDVLWFGDVRADVAAG